MKKFIIIGLLFGLILNAQTYWNMEEIWKTGVPEPDSIYNLSRNTCYGDINGDGYSDVGIKIDSLGTYGGVAEQFIYIYFGPPDTIPDLILRSPGGDEGFGFGLTCGDVNGDGYDDILVGAEGSQKVYIYLGGNPPDSTVDVILRNTSETSLFGHHLAYGDFNGDGYGDIAVSAYYENQGLGSVYIYYGGTTFDTIPDVVLHATVSTGDFGLRISAGDLNNDGYCDLAVATWPINVPQPLYIFNGGNPMDTLPDLIIYGPDGWGNFGNVISVVPDMNGDGYAELVAGCASHDTLFFYSGGNPMDTTVDLVFSGEGYERFGYSVAGIDSADGDRYGDLIISATYYGSPSDLPAANGRVCIYTGSLFPDTVIDGYAVGVDSSHIGWWVNSAGDVDGDGKDELLFTNYAEETSSEKKVWICRYTGPSGFKSVKKPVKLNFQVESVSPNPFLKETEIIYSLPFKGKVSIEVYDELGRMVDRCIYGKKDAGRHRIRWGNGMKKGVYFIRIEAETHSEMVEKTIKVVRL